MTPTIFITTADSQLIAARVSAHSLRSRSTSPEKFNIQLLRAENFPQLWDRDGQTFRWWKESPNTNHFSRRDAQSFLSLRRAVPQMMGYRGRALVIDPDVFAVGDVWELLDRDMGDKAILCRRMIKRVGGKPQEAWSTSVMLLDCARLQHWRWDEEIAEIFSGQRMLGEYLSLMDEPPENIGLFEEHWNHMDTLNAETELLHNSGINTQPWKTGLPADYHEFTIRRQSLRQRLRQFLRTMVGRPGKPVMRYQPHPDPRQEAHFFLLLQQCLDAGTITRKELKRAMRLQHLRADAFKLLQDLARVDAGFQH